MTINTKPSVKSSNEKEISETKEKNDHSSKDIPLIIIIALELTKKIESTV